MVGHNQEILRMLRTAGDQTQRAQRLAAWSFQVTALFHAVVELSASGDADLPTIQTEARAALVCAQQFIEESTKGDFKPR